MWLYKNIFFFLSSRRFKFESVITLSSMKNGTWFLDEQDTSPGYKAEHRVEEVCCSKCLLCLSGLFIYILTSQFIKKLKKKIKRQKNQKLEFCWIKCAPKNKCARQLWDIPFIFFSLMNVSWPFIKNPKECKHWMLKNTCVIFTCSLFRWINSSI